MQNEDSLSNNVKQAISFLNKRLLLLFKFVFCTPSELTPITI